MSVFIGDNWLVLLIIAAAILGVAFVLSADAPVARRVFSRFLFNIALPLAVIFGVPLAIMATVLELETRLWAAIVAGSVIATGWLTSTIFSELGKTQNKAERLRDYHKALYAEIGNTLAAYYADGHAEDYADALIARMEQHGDFVPFIPLESHDRVFAALVDEIEVLPRQTIDTVIAFYSLVASIGALANDMRSTGYTDLSQDRRILIYKDYFLMRQRAAQLGEYALNLIKEYSDGGATAAEALAHRVNNPDADPRHPSTGSV